MLKQIVSIVSGVNYNLTVILDESQKGTSNFRVKELVEARFRLFRCFDSSELNFIASKVRRLLLKKECHRSTAVSKFEISFK
jgi:hypothetical protein